MPRFKNIVGNNETSEVIFKDVDGSVHCTFISDPKNKKQLQAVKIKMAGDATDLYKQTIKELKEQGRTVYEEQIDAPI